jgi:catalase
VLFDAVVLPDGNGSSKAPGADGHVLEFIKDQYRHCKPLLVLGNATTLLTKTGIPSALPSGEPDPGLIIGADGDTQVIDDFIAALGQHRHFERETDPPRV